MSVLFHQFLYNLLLLAGIFIIASLIVKLGNFEFLNETIGFFFLVTSILCTLATVGAIYFTGFRTILLGIPVLLIVYFFFHSRSEVIKPTKKFERRLLFEWLLVHMILFGVFYYVSNATPSNHVNIPSRDLAFYARTSFNLVETGIETPVFNPIYEQSNRLEPYHYLDVWLNGILSKFANNNHLLNFYYIVYPLGISVTWLGLCALISLVKDLTGLDRILAFLGLMVAGSVTSVTLNFSSFMNSISAWQFLADTPPGYLLFNIWHFPKIFPVYWVMIASLIFLVQRKVMLFFFALFSLCFLFTPCAPGIVMGSTMFTILRTALIKRWDKTMEYLITMILVTTVFMGCFYWMLQTSPAIPSVGPEEHILKMIKRGIRYLFDGSLQTVNVYILWLLPLFLYALLPGRLKKVYAFWIVNKEAVLLITTLFFSSLFAWGFFRVIQDADQMYSNFGLILLNILIAIIYSIIIANNSGKKIIYASFIVLYMGTAYFSFSPSLRYGSNFFPERLYGDEFLDKVKAISPKLSPTSVYLFSKEDYNTNFSGDVEILGQYLSMFRSDVIPISLSIFNMSVFKSNQRLPEGLLANPFFQFVEEQKQNGNFVSIDQSQCDFINNFKINHIIVRKREDVPSCISVKEEIVDRASGQILVFIGDNSMYD